MLSNRESFKVGFLARCAESGMSQDQILGLVKTAQEKLALFGEAIDAGKDLAGGVLRTAWPLALAAPPILGGLAGAGLAKATDINDEDVDEVKDREVIDAYHTEAEKLKRQKAVRDYAKARFGSTGRRLF